MKNEEKKKFARWNKITVEAERLKIHPLEFFVPERRSIDGREDLNIIRMNLPRDRVRPGGK